jgi:sugar-phosphatase
MGARVATSAVLCDLDGTLIDSLPSLREAYRRFVADHAPDADAPPFERWNGTALRDVVRGLELELSLDGGHDQLLEQYLALLEHSYVGHSALAPGALDLLDDVRARGLRTAIVTSAPRAMTMRVLERCALLDRADTVVTGDDVDQAKPSPAGYLEALRRLGVAADNAIAVEDSPAGAQAAIAAGLRCIVIAGDGTDSAWITASGAQASPDLADALELLRGA